jgi:hypothetical protein
VDPLAAPPLEPPLVDPLLLLPLLLLPVLLLPAPLLPPPLLALPLDVEPGRCCEVPDVPHAAAAAAMTIVSASKTSAAPSMAPAFFRANESMR